MKHEESRLQQNCVKWFRYQYPEPKYLIYANANGGARSRIEAMIMKGEGVLLTTTLKQDKNLSERMFANGKDKIRCDLEHKF